MCSGGEGEETTMDKENPYVLQILDVQGLAEQIIYPQRNCIVFVAMRYCRTCKSINTMFTKLARDAREEEEEEDGGNGNEWTMVFAKVDATGASGRALGKQLGIVAVPSFYCFGGGYGMGQCLRQSY